MTTSYKRLVTLWCVVWTMLLAPYGWAAGAEQLLRGKGFSDPTKQVEMPKEWTDQSIQYKEWAKEADIAINIDQQFYPLILPIVSRYAKENNLNIIVQKGTCGTAFKDLSDKAADIGGFCCPPSQNDRIPGVKFHTLGIEALPVMVNKKNPINALSYEQVQQIFQGQIVRWSELEVSPGVPGPKSIIQTVARLHCKQRPGHWHLLLDNEDLFSPRLFNVGSMEDMIGQVANNPDAIGFEELYMLEHHDEEGQVKVISINGVSPDDVDKLGKGEYPLYNTLSMTTWESENTKNPEANKLVDYVIKHMDEIPKKYGVASVAKLRAAGWKFVGEELVGEPTPK